jgi:hypothetical protein
MARVAWGPATPLPQPRCSLNLFSSWLAIVGTELEEGLGRKRDIAVYYEVRCPPVSGRQRPTSAANHRGAVEEVRLDSEIKIEQAWGI